MNKKREKKCFHVPVNCKQCGDITYHNKYYYKKMNGVVFCSQRCCVYYKDPKQSKIMEHINSTNFYYLIGLLATDGYICYPGAENIKRKIYQCVIKLSKKDKEILYRIQNIFGGSINKENNENTYSWYISNKDFICYLKDVVGLTNKKTYTLDTTTWFLELKQQFKNAFIRGCYDGDGTVFFSHTDFFRCHSAICSASKKFADMFLNYYQNSRLNVHKKERTTGYSPTCDLYYVYLNGRNILQMKDVYQLDTEKDLYLKRKYDTYKHIQWFYEDKNRDKDGTINFPGIE
jgi:hypothetical protein